MKVTHTTCVHAQSHAHTTSAHNTPSNTRRPHTHTHRHARTHRHAQRHPQPRATRKNTYKHKCMSLPHKNALIRTLARAHTHHTQKHKIRPKHTHTHTHTHAHTAAHARPNPRAHTLIPICKRYVCVCFSASAFAAHHAHQHTHTQNTCTHTEHTHVCARTHFIFECASCICVPHPPQYPTVCLGALVFVSGRLWGPRRTTLDQKNNKTPKMTCFELGNAISQRVFETQKVRLSPSIAQISPIE
jgi:hypothetical protein